MRGFSFGSSPAAGAPQSFLCSNGPPGAPPPGASNSYRGFSFGASQAGAAPTDASDSLRGFNLEEQGASFAPDVARSARRSKVNSYRARGSTEQDSVPFSSCSLRLTLCQNADGSFPADNTTATILGLDLHNLIESGRPEEPLVWATILCLLYLEEKCQAERDSWELVAEKASKWLVCRGVVMSGPLEQRANQLIREG